MPTYIYETIPSDPNQEPRRFEVTQRMSDDALECDPSSGEKVKKIITGGFGVVGNVLRRSTVVNKASAAATACGGTGHRRLRTRRSPSVADETGGGGRVRRRAGD